MTGLCPSSDCAAATYTFRLTGGMKNPPYVKPLTGNFVVKSTDSSGALINRNIIANSDVTEILPTVITTGSVVRSSTTLGGDSDYTFSFETINTLEQNGKFILTLDLNQVSLKSGSSPTCFKSDGTTEVSCTVTSSSDSQAVIEMTEFCSTDANGCAAGTTVTLIIKNLANPLLLSANFATTSFAMATATSNSYKIDEISTGVLATPNIEGVAVEISGIDLADPVVNHDSTLSFTFKPKSNLPSNAYVTVTIPAFVAIVPSSPGCAMVLPSSTTMSCTYTTATGTGRRRLGAVSWGRRLATSQSYYTSVVFNNFCSNSNCEAETTHQVSINMKVRQNSKAVGGNFLVTTATSAADIGSGSLANSITINPEPFTDTALDNGGCNAIKATCSLTVSFKSVNTFPTSSDGGRILMNVPSDIIGNPDLIYMRS